MQNYSLKKIEESNWWMIFVLCLLFAIAPIIGFVLSVICFRQKISIVFFVLFSFYFGWFYEPQMDLLVHYNHFKTLVGKSIIDSWSAQSTQTIGKEVYPVIFKYFIGYISRDPHFFSACAACVYSISFCAFLQTIRKYYIQKIDYLGIALFLGIILTIEYFWFLGFRFWTGAFIFLIFAIKYLITRQVKYLILSALACLFHFSHAILLVVFIVDIILNKNIPIRIFIIIISIIFRLIGGNIFLIILPKLTFLKGYIEYSVFDIKRMTAIYNYTDEYRATGNQFYLIRTDILFFALLSTAITLYYHDRDIFKFNPKYFRFLLTFYAIVNFGFADITFYDREYKLFVIMTFIYLFIYLTSCPSYLLNRNQSLKVSIPLYIAILYAILTIGVSQREYLWNINLWFNNFLF